MRKLDVGATLREVFATYWEHAAVLMPLAFWLFLGVAIVEEATRESLAVFWLGIVVSIGVATLYQGMVVGLVADAQSGREPSVRDLMRSALPVLGPLIGAGLLAGLGIGAGFLLLVVPGLYLATIWAVVAPAIVVERRGVFDAFGRSRQLVRENGWPVFWVLAVAYLIEAAAAVAFGLIAISFADEPLIRIVFAALASILTAPITALVASVLYFRLLAIHDEAAAPEPAVAGSVPQ